MNKISLILSIIILSFSSTTSGAEIDFTALEILERSANIYSSCKTYSDKGYVKTIFIGNNEKVEFATKLVFKTSFVRPNSFRFEYAEEQAGELLNKYIIWKNGVDLKSYWEIQGEDKPESLSMAIAAATGVSGGSALNISSLLFPDIHRNPLLTQSKKPILLAEQKDENNILCYRIQTNDNEILWIQKVSFLIAKIEETSAIQGMKSKTTTVYKPNVDIEIPVIDLQYKTDI